MNNKRILLIVVLMALVVAVVFIVKPPFSEEEILDYKFSINDFENVMDISGKPEHYRDRSVFCMTDNGSWHGHGLHNTDSIVDFSGFTGPYVMTTGWGIWTGESLLKIKLYNDQGEVLQFNPEQIKNKYLPGRLLQEITTEELKIKAILWFVSERTSILKTEIEALSDNAGQYSISLEGETFVPKAGFYGEEEGIMLNFNDTTSFGIFPLGGLNAAALIAEDSSTYRVDLGDKITIEKGKAFNMAIANSVCFSNNEMNQEKEKLDAYYAAIDESLTANEDRWNGYVNSVLSIETHWLQEKIYQNLAVKSILTLTNNWRSAAPNIYHAGLFPSYNAWYFNGFWSWDSWKHAVALAKFDTEIAKDQMRVMFDYQNEVGMVPDVIYTSPEDNNWRDTKPPLASWAVWEIYKNSGDKSFIEEFYPMLVKYHQWWYADRDHDKNGLCEFGSTDGTRIAAAWESGMDNAVRFDNTEMVKNHDKAWSFNQESVDLNAYLYGEKLFLAQMAEVLGKTDEKMSFETEAKKLKEDIISTFYNEEQGFYYDVDLFSKEQIIVEGPEGWTAAWVGLAEQDHVEGIKNIITDTAKFFTHCPFPTITYDHPKFDPQNGYWRGPVWLDQAYFGISSLKKYGFDAEADKLTKQLFENGKGILTDEPLRENYHPITGDGLNANHFSWSAAHILMLLTE